LQFLGLTHRFQSIGYFADDSQAGHLPQHRANDSAKRFEVFNHENPDCWHSSVVIVSHPNTFLYTKMIAGRW
jgi:hypothetical protein